MNFDLVKEIFFTTRVSFLIFLMAAAGENCLALVWFNEVKAACYFHQVLSEKRGDPNGLLIDRLPTRNILLLPTSKIMLRSF